MFPRNNGTRYRRYRGDGIAERQRQKACTTTVHARNIRTPGHADDAESSRLKHWTREPAATEAADIHPSRRGKSFNPAARGEATGLPTSSPQTVEHAYATASSAQAVEGAHAAASPPRSRTASKEATPAPNAVFKTLIYGNPDPGASTDVHSGHRSENQPNTQPPCPNADPQDPPRGPPRGATCPRRFRDPIR